MRLKDLTLREKVYRTFITPIKRMRGEGTLKELFDKYPIGGLYFAGEVIDVGQGMYDGGIPASGTKHHLPNAMCLQEGN